MSVQQCDSKCMQFVHVRASRFWCAVIVSICRTKWWCWCQSAKLV